MRTMDLSSRRERLLILFATAVVVGVVAGAGIAAIAGDRHPSALDRAVGAADALSANAQGIGVLRAGDSRRIASFRSGNGEARAVYLTRTEDGKSICLWDTELATGAQGGGCNDADNFFGGRQMLISLAYEGGPSVASVADARIVGVVTSRVARVDVVNSEGSASRVAITPDSGFAYIVPRGQLRAGAGSVEVVAYDADGAIVDRQTTGIG